MYYWTPEQYAASPEYQEHIQKFPEAGGDLSTLWHLNNLMADWPRFIRGVIATWDAASEQDKIHYASAIGKMMSIIFKSGDDLYHWMYALDAPQMSFVATYLLPQFATVYHQVYMERSLEAYLQSAFAHNVNLPTEEQRAQHAAGTKALIKKYAPENWADLIPQELKEKIVQTFFKEELEQIQIAAMETEKATNMKIIGMLALGAFGLFALTRMMGRRRK